MSRRASQSTRSGSDLPHEPPQPDSPAQPLRADRLLIRLDEVATALGISRRTLERERSAGRFPRPDKIIGRMPLWRPGTIEVWVEGGGN
jgi:predicted DNA-binding transcriptional regulator AlpA